jgi:HSP20 family protein
MVYDLLPGSFWRIPARTWDEDEDWGVTTQTQNNLSISEDDTNVYVEAALPGVDPKHVEVTFDRGIVWIKGETNTEEKGKKFYRKAASQFSYRVAVPGDIDMNKEPVATSKNGVMTVSFVKAPSSQPKKIMVRV